MNCIVCQTELTVDKGAERSVYDYDREALPTEFYVLRCPAKDYTSHYVCKYFSPDTHTHWLNNGLFSMTWSTLTSSIYFDLYDIKDSRKIIMAKTFTNLTYPEFIKKFKSINNLKAFL